MGSNQDYYFMSTYGADDDPEEQARLSANSAASPRTYLHSPIVADAPTDAPAAAAPPVRAAQQLSARRDATREEAARNEAIRSVLYDDPMYELYDYDDDDHDRSTFTSMSKPYPPRSYAARDAHQDGPTDDQQRILEKLDDSHRDREYVSRPSRGPSMYQRMRMREDGEEDGDTPLGRASTLLRRQLSKRRSQAPDGALRRSLLGADGPPEDHGDASIPLQEMSRGMARPPTHSAALEQGGGSGGEGGGFGAPAQDAGGEFRTVHIGNQESNA
ncbi:hypothetical protein H4R19_003868, partial [Coemansia spiralis]